MVGSYPRPSWFTYQLAGRDIWEAFKVSPHAEAFEDAVRAVLKDQERAGLDIVTDGQMWFDDYGGAIGSFVWYWYERLGGFARAKEAHPRFAHLERLPEDARDWGGATVVDKVRPGPTRLAELFRIAQPNATRPIKFCVGAGPVNLGFHVYYEAYRDQRELAYDLAPIFNAEMKALVAAGARYLQLEDLGAWVPVRSGNPRDFEWVVDVINRTVEGVDAVISWHFCYGNGWGNVSPHLFAGGDYGAILPHLANARVHQFVLDFAVREMRDVGVLKSLPAGKDVAVGVIDVRTLQIEKPEDVAARIRKVLEVVPAERVTLTTDCGMKALPRFVAYNKLRALVGGARIVRKELGGG
jgi:5-methyltetrahydropteroyltriglutamate--homocysteine methyltransferase